MKRKIVFIEGEKIYLRPILETDDKMEYLRWLNNPKINEYSNRIFLPTSEKARDRFLMNCEENKNLLLAVVIKKDHKHIGNILLSSIDWINRKGEMSILIGEEDSQGRGFAKEAWRLLTRHAFLRLNLNRLEAGTIHPAMRAILESQGWTHEGTLRKAFFSSGKYLDIKRYGLLREEFLENPR